MPRDCVNKPSNFCYICGDVTFKSQKRNITPLIRKAYNLYFGCKVGDQDKKWAPHICCNTCTNCLRDCLNGKSRSMPFAVPMVWREPKDHATDCYFCLTPPISKGVTMKNKANLRYPNLPSAIGPVPHADLACSHSSKGI